MVRSYPQPSEARHLMREYLQARILRSLQRMGAMASLAFHGGTALRFLYGISRYSEGLDFALEHVRDLYDFRGYLRQIKAQLSAEGYPVELKVKDKRTVHSAFIRFHGLLYQSGLSPHRSEVLSIKIEVDTNPPAGATTTTTLIRRHLTLQLQHHDRTSMLAGKLHAVLQRTYTKGRDIYDLFWYLTEPDWPKPNLVMLNHALEQTGWQKERLTEQNWRDFAAQKVQRLHWAKVLADVQPFLIRGEDTSLLSKENVLRLLAK
jgi:predicted nucleotidyltransferase component of viral defense system